jgi:hypothetical protein
VRGGTSDRANLTRVTWIYNFPLWVFATIAIAIMCGLTAYGTYLARRYGGQNMELSRNDVAGPVVSVAGTVLAVMLSFMVVVVWQEYDASAGSVLREAGALSDLHQEANAFPPAVRDRLQSQIDQYADLVVHIEWPEMRTGGRNGQADDVARFIEGDVLAYNPTSAVQTSLQANALDLVHTFLDARRQRLFDNNQGISPYVWGVMLFLSVATLFLTFLFRSENAGAHLIMTIALAAIIAMILVLIAELDYPFRGTLQIQPTAFVQIMKTIHRPTGAPPSY